MSPAGERGAAAPAVIGLACALVLVTVVLLVGGRLVVERRRAAAAADLAALAGAVALQHLRPPCPDVARAAEANDVELVSCRVEGDEVRVGTEVTVRLLGRDLTVAARAHAGPVGPRSASSTSSSVTASVFANGLLRLPHFGDWTQDGQPDSHSQPAIVSRVARSQARAASKPRWAKPAPPGWPS